MSLHFNMLSRFVIAFLPRSKCLLISQLQSMSAVILEPKKIKSVIVSTFPPSVCHEVVGQDAMILVFWMLNFKPTFSLLFFTLIKRLFSSPSLSAIKWYHLRVWGCWYFFQQSWLQLVLHSSLTFLMMYSAYKLNKQGDNVQSWHTPFPILNQSVVPCKVLLLIGLHTGFSGGRSGDPVLISL